MRACLLLLNCLVAIGSSSVSAMAEEEPGSRSPSETNFTVLIGEFEYAVSSLGKPGLGEVAGRDTLQTIAIFIIQRQPLEPKRLELLEEHREDLIQLLQSERRGPDAAVLLMWMNAQANKDDADVMLQVQDFKSSQLFRLQRLVKFLSVRVSKKFQELLEDRQIDDETDPDELDEDKLDELEEGFVGMIYDKSLGNATDISACLAVLRISNDKQDECRAIANILQLISDVSLKKSEIDLLVENRREFRSYFDDHSADMGMRGMLAVLMLWIDKNSNEGKPLPQHVINSLDSYEMSVMIMGAAMVGISERKEFLSIVSDRFVNGDSETACAILDALEVQAERHALKMSVAVELFEKFAARPSLTSDDSKQMKIILKELRANEAK